MKENIRAIFVYRIE